MEILPVGIDLGTTHSLLAVFGTDGEVVLVPGANGDVLTPSAVSLSDDNQLLVGAPAQSRRLSHPTRTHVAFKRHMGTGRKFTLGKQDYSASELSALILRKLKDDFHAAYPGKGIGDLVISVPAYFSSVQREATILAAEMAELPKPRLVNEPTAAALAYGLAEREGESTFIVLDLGGGTFDVSIIEMFEGVIEVRASSGDALLGGEDFTTATAQHIARQLELDWDHLEPDLRARLVGAAEAMKRRLSNAETAELTLEIKGGERIASINRAQFEELAAPLLMRLRRPIERSLYDAKVAIEKIDRVILVGGATRMPMIRGLAGRMLRKLPESGLNPDEVVARGAAVQAAMLHRNQALDDLVMTDVAPFSLGIRSRVGTQMGQIDDGFAPIIERNTTLPASRVQHFWTASNGQTSVHVAVYQGESPLASENVLIGTTDVAVPPNNAGEEGIAVRFSYDASGLLHVGITVISTGKETQMVIEGRSSNMDSAEKARRIKALEAYMQHPRDDAANIGLIERLKTLYAMLLSEDRQNAAALLARFESVLSGQDPREIETVRKEIETIAGQIEDNYVR